MSIALIKYTLQLADNALVLGQRLGEWCGHGPILEQDIALTNTALDHLGQARNFYQYAAQLYNQLEAHEQAKIFSSTVLENKHFVTEDDLAFLRDGWDYKNILLVEQPNGDWAVTIARSFFYDSFQYCFYQQLAQCGDSTLAAIAEKSLKEVIYHRKWSSEWVIRLGDGTAESKDKMQNAINLLWKFTGEFFEASLAEQEVNLIANNSLKAGWQQWVSEVINEAQLTLPNTNVWMQKGGKEGLHTEHLGYILADLQFMQRAYPNMEW